jgi:hypothetical protein
VYRAGMDQHPDTRADLKVEVLGLQVGEGDRPDQGGRGEHAGLHGLQPPHGMMPRPIEGLEFMEEAVIALGL